MRFQTTLTCKSCGIKGFGGVCVLTPSQLEYQVKYFDLSPAFAAVRHFVLWREYRFFRSDRISAHYWNRLNRAHHYPTGNTFVHYWRFQGGPYNVRKYNQGSKRQVSIR